MANFKNFELNNSEMIFGGELKPTDWSGENGETGEDLYDTVRKRVVYSPAL